MVAIHCNYISQIHNSSYAVSKGHSIRIEASWEEGAENQFSGTEGQAPLPFKITQELRVARLLSLAGKAISLRWSMIN